MASHRIASHSTESEVGIIARGPMDQSARLIPNDPIGYGVFGGSNGKVCWPASTVPSRRALLSAFARDTSVCLMNYKADGTPFWNQFFVAALKDENEKVGGGIGSP